MAIFNNIQTISGQRESITLGDSKKEAIDASHLLKLPGLIDPHVHFRVPGQEYKEDWICAAKATLAGGYTTVFDMPNNIPACVTEQRFADKKQLIDQQLATAGIPLNYELYLGADRYHFDEIPKLTSQAIAIKVFMGSSTGDLLMDDDSSLHAVFAVAAAHDMLVAVHAEEECMIQERTQQFANATCFSTHSKIRNPAVAAAAVEKAIYLSKLYGTRLYILHVSTSDELVLIEQAKKAGLPVFAETSPHHLFLNTNDYEKLGAKVQVNPPIRETKHQAALLDAIERGIIDTVGSDHAPHTLTEKSQAYGQAPSGIPGIQTNVPLLLTAVKNNKIALNKIPELLYHNVCKVFRYQPKQVNTVLVDLTQQKTVTDNMMLSKCGWTPYVERELSGWPAYVSLGDKLFDVTVNSPKLV